VASLRVTIVSTARGRYGGEEQVRLLAHGLRERGHACSVLARAGDAFAACMAADGFDTSEFPGRGFAPAGLLAIRRRLIQLRPDVLHLNDSPALTSAGMASLGLGIPLRVVSRRVDFALRWSLPYRRFCDRVLCVSHAVADICRDSGVPADRLRIVHDGCDPARVRSGVRSRGRLSLGLSEHETLLLTVAGLRDHKGHRFLLAALPGILAQRPNVVLALAGDGHLEQELRQQARELGIETRVHFLGYRNDAPDLIAACDLFVLPSHQEGLCSSLIDAMLASRPIVTTTAGGIPDLVGRRANDADADAVAWLVPPGDSAALAEAVLDALQSPQQCARHEKNARERAERLFTAAAMVEATLDVYREALARTAIRKVSQAYAGRRTA